MKILKSILSGIYKKLKGEELNIDNRVPDSYLFRFYFAKFIALLRGICFFKKKCFVAKKVRVDCKRNIRFGKNFSLCENVYICALSDEVFLFGDNVSVGKNTRIEGSGAFSFLGKGIKCGNNTSLGTDSFYGCAGGIEIGSDTIVGNFVSFHSENHNFDAVDVKIRLQGVNHKGISIGNNCWIGSKTTILDGAKVGNGCVIAAGAVVRGEFPDNVVIGGVPAKIIKQRCK